METITVSASRASTFTLSEMELLVGTAIVIGLLAWMLVARMKRERAGRQA